MSVLPFREEVRQKPLDVTRAALSFAHEIAYPRLEVDRYLQELDALTSSARLVVPPDASPVDQALTLADYLFVREGFRGNQADYMDPRNSFLNDVLDRRLGIPISLSVIFLHVGTKLGVPVSGVGLPGHFIVCVRGEGGTTYLDPFNEGVILSPGDCSRLVGEATGYDGHFQKEWLRKSRPAEILTRMLNNLRGIYIQQEDWRNAADVVEHLRMIWPGSMEFVRDLGLLRYREGSRRSAVELLAAYLRQQPDAPDAADIQRCMRFICKELATLN
ncbi:MAG TPA: transglutaminase-like domain-containing protein [Anaerolineales bacterium]|nr:transglutaminase-like domain-containing protein [Anaerolineales bacterium]